MTTTYTLSIVEIFAIVDSVSCIFPIFYFGTETYTTFSNGQNDKSTVRLHSLSQQWQRKRWRQLEIFSYLSHIYRFIYMLDVGNFCFRMTLRLILNVRLTQSISRQRQPVQMSVTRHAIKSLFFIIRLFLFVLSDNNFLDIYAWAHDGCPFAMCVISLYSACSNCITANDDTPVIILFCAINSEKVAWRRVKSGEMSTNEMQICGCEKMARL